ncbi:hypothetical protein MKY89_30195 [Bacillus sp. FSL W7-1294]|uniref:hypothetical protein n=1 Tax=Bacillus TaxID=1386 RepID=UPI000AEB5529|nr:MULTISPECIES: hypothetical protein [Bacillus cereus group]MED2996375.1 hypothetical protein [Bacillus tropicus]
MSFIIICPKCGHNNTEEDIEYTTITCGASCGCEGYEYELNCSSCNNEIDSGSSWGEFERKEVAEEIQEQLLSDIQNIKELSNNNRRVLVTFGDSITRSTVGSR